MCSFEFLNSVLTKQFEIDSSFFRFFYFKNFKTDRSFFNKPMRSILISFSNSRENWPVFNWNFNPWSSLSVSTTILDLTISEFILWSTNLKK
jgi:hypothetical protein